MIGRKKDSYSGWYIVIAWLGIFGCNLVAQDGGGGRTGDNDLMSSAVELNPPNQRLYHFDTAATDTDPSRALGAHNNGTLQNGINLPDNHANYYHFRGPDALDTDDWGTLRLVNVGEAVATDWGDATRPCVFEDLAPPTRFGILDLSRGSEVTRTFGGVYPPHAWHQNGRDMDVRYLRTDGREDPLDISGPDSVVYDNFATADLMTCFLSYRDVDRIIVDTEFVKIDFGGDPVVLHDTTHRDHFHISIVDPDGTAN